MRYPPGTNDRMLNDSLWFGDGYERPVAPEFLEVMARMGRRHSGWTPVGNDAIRDEVTILELGPHVEMEMDAQASAPETHGSMGFYLECLLMMDVDLDDLIDLDEADT